MKSKSKSRSRRKPKPHIAIQPESQSEFAFAVARTAVSQICHSAGFQSAQLSALHALTAVAATFLRAAAKTAADTAASANRTDSNVFDVTAALEDLRAGSLADVAAFVRSTAETPFAKPIPQPQPQPQCRPNSAPAGGSGPIPRPPHVPAWLPEAPTIANASGDRGRGGEERWEDAPGPSGVGVVAEEREEEVGLREERERVRFEVCWRSKHRIKRKL